MRVILLVHRWFGLTFGVLLALSGLTGALLVFGHEIERGLDPALHRASSAASVSSLDAMLEEVQQVHPERSVSYIRFPRAEDGTYEFWLDGSSGPRVYVDPGSGKVLGSREPDQGFVGFIRELHVHLLAGPQGDKLVGTVGVAAFLLFAAGGGIWWASRRGRGGLRPEAARLHRKMALYGIALLSITVLTGAILAFSAFVRNALDALAGVSAPRPLVALSAARPRLDAALAAARSALPLAQVTWVYPAAAPGAAVKVRLRTPEEHHPNGLSSVWVDPGSGTVLRIDRASQAGLGTRLFDWIYPLHIGTLGSNPHRILLILVGILPALLLASGVMTYVRRRKALSAARNRALKAIRHDACPNHAGAGLATSAAREDRATPS